VKNVRSTVTPMRKLLCFHQRISHSPQYRLVSHPTTDNPDIPMDRTPVGSSTPSRKRSRWDNDEEQDIPTQPSPKHFLKPKHSKAPTTNFSPSFPSPHNDPASTLHHQQTNYIPYAFRHGRSTLRLSPLFPCSPTRG
jgi:hypothetical protein